jgi:DNA-binding CsgD family transcriptional regulator
VYLPLKSLVLSSLLIVSESSTRLYGPAIMSNLFSQDFLERAAVSQHLSRTEKNMLKLVYGEDLSYEQINDRYGISKSTAHGQMRRVYEKFGIEGEGKGKFEKLKFFLLELKDRQLKPHVTNAEHSANQMGAGSTIPTQNPLASIFSRLSSLEEKFVQMSTLQETILEIPWQSGNSVREDIECIYEILQKGEISPQAVLQNFPIFVKDLSVLVSYSEKDLALRLLDVLIEMLKDSDAVSNSTMVPNSSKEPG